MPRTRVTVVSNGDEWEVREDGFPLFSESSKRVAESDARRIARRKGAILRIQNRHGAWQTVVTY